MISKQLLGLTAALLAGVPGGAQAIQTVMEREGRKTSKRVASNKPANVTRQLKKAIGARQFKKLQRKAREAQQ